ncbi:sarcosine oxidase subunit beta family protein [Stakelama tenebrarum]|uniref:Sarcosine oxidase subunit beta family protein n=1 Tax=Stakelama tenebrarum TaxID=2711215 RepID=A0A6G6Y5J3_9SPHN|nr:sarcosine oxidase subunit beta family protein [Sphingosinithalassobacter tenebrarum]QIG80169.1 sarcosine oxidase subunit beta family protein [Sphingosinithalassobacter tenebrarum]
MRDRYSALALLRGGLTGNRGWKPAWRSPEPKPAYDAVIVGGGGHGLATAYYLASRHGMRKIAVLEKGWIGGGNTGRNTTIVRSDYYYPESAALFDHSVTLYEGLSRELNFNIMFSQRGMMTTAHSRGELDFQRRLVNGMRLNGVDLETVPLAEIRRDYPYLNFAPDARYPILGGMRQKRAGTVRHDAVVWGYARAADRLGVDIIQNCEVTGILRDPMTGAVSGVDTSRGRIATTRLGLAVAGHSSVLAEMAGFRLPLRSYALQAFVTEPLKPVLDTIVSSSLLGIYVSQSDKGGLVFGGNADPYASYAQRGNIPTAEEVIAGLVEFIPSFSRIRLLRQWAGIVDYAQDSSPVLGRSPVPGVFLNCGWGGGGFKAIPAGGETFAHTIATGDPHPLTVPFSLDRFRELALVDEAAAAGIAH